jgi:hypothetical protein
MTARYPLVRVGADISELPAGDTLLGVSGGGSTDAVKMHRLIKNNTGITLLKGQAVYINGATGINVTVALAQADTESTSSKTLGLIEADILDGSTGYVVTEGELIDFDTSAATNEGDSVWLSPTIAGGLVYGLANKPVAPYHMVYLGVVSRKNPSNGVILVKVQNGYELNELHNVLISSISDKQLLKYDSVTSLWKNDVITYSEISGTVPTWNQNTTGTAANVTGTVAIANGGTGLTSLGTNVATFLGTPTSANLLATITDETGTGSLVFNTTPTLIGFRETKVAMAANAINLALGAYFSKTFVAGAVTLTISNVAGANIASSFILDATNMGLATITFWTTIKWAGGTSPTFTASGRDIVSFYTHDGGTTWNGIVIAKDIK